MGDMEEDSRRAVRHCWTSKDADSKHSAPELPRTFPDASGSKATSIENQKSQHRHTSFYCTSPYQDLQLLSLGGLFLLAFFPPTTWRSVATLPWASLIVKVIVAESCLTLCNHTDCCPPGFPVHVILQTRILEWVAIAFSGGSSQSRDRTPGPLHCRRILYHLSHQGSPLSKSISIFFPSVSLFTH